MPPRSVSGPPGRLLVQGIAGLPDIRPGDDLAAILVRHLARRGPRPRPGDVVAVTHKVVSKAEGRVVSLAGVEPGQAATRLAGITGHDPRLVEVCLWESRRVLAARPGLLIAEHRLGFVCANAGVDRSNVGPEPGTVCLLPAAPEVSARRLRDALAERFGRPLAVIILDTHGRPFREGAVGVTIGSWGMRPLADLRGRPDRYGYVMRSAVEAVADELAAAASLVMGQCDEGVPAAVIRGFPFEPAEAGGSGLVRDPARDVFRRPVDMER